jgi:hypothetical protein
MQCPQCGAENPEGATYCNLCQTSFVQRHGYDPAPGQLPSASEWTGSSTPAAPTGKGKSSNTLLIWLIVLIIVACGIIGAVVLLKKGGVSAGTYKSKVSGLTFNYPVTWQEIAPAELQKIGVTWSGDASDVNENVIVDSPTTSCRNAIFCVSTAGVDDSRWATTVRDQVLAKFQSNPAHAGEQMSAVTLKCGPAVAVSGTTTTQNQTARYRIVVVNHNKTNYMLSYLTIDPSVDIDSQWKTIEDSIGFTN